MDSHSALVLAMTKYFRGDPKRIQHFIKVHSFAKIIGTTEGLSDNQMFILETAAITHDIGIKVSEQKYGSSDGKHQEEEGPAEAEKLLSSLGYPDNAISSVCWLIAHHHTYNDITFPEYRILVESDFLVNLYEDGVKRESAISAYNNIFITETGRQLCRDMFDFTDAEADAYRQ